MYSTLEPGVTKYVVCVRLKWACLLIQMLRHKHVTIYTCLYNEIRSTIVRWYHRKTLYLVSQYFKKHFFQYK